MKPEMITEATLQKAVQEAVVSAKKEALSEMVQKVRLGLGLNGVKGEAQKAIDKLLELLVQKAIAAERNQEGVWLKVDPSMAEVVRAMRAS